MFTRILISAFLRFLSPAPSPADDEPCSSSFCCEGCDDNDQGCTPCYATPRDGCSNRVVTCGAGGCYNGGGACGNSSEPWSGGCCS